MRSLHKIQSNSCPVVFLGSCASMHNIIELCHTTNRNIAGIYDPDYKGELYGLPLLDDSILSLKEKYEFFVATGWAPDSHPLTIRNNQKRESLIDLMVQYNLIGATLIHPSCVISPHARIGRNVSIGAMTMITARAEIEDDVNIKEQCYISHDARIGKNTVVQIKATVTGNVHVGKNSWVGINSSIVNPSALGEPMKIGDNVLIHPGVLVMQSLPSGAVASLRSRRFSKVF